MTLRILRQSSSQAYLGAPAYRRKGPPPVLLRLLGPAVVILTVIVLACGVALLVAGPAWSGQLLFVPKASFVLWFFALAHGKTVTGPRWR